MRTQRVPIEIAVALVAIVLAVILLWRLSGPTYQRKRRRRPGVNAPFRPAGKTTTAPTVPVGAGSVALDWRPRLDGVFAPADGELGPRGTELSHPVGARAWRAFIREDDRSESAARRQKRPLQVSVSFPRTASEFGPLLDPPVGDASEWEAQIALRRLASIVDSAQEAIISTTLDGRILTWNAGAEQLYGFRASEAIGERLSMIIPPGHEADVAAMSSARVRRGMPVPRYETLRRCKNGTIVEVAITESPVWSPSGEILAVSIIARDITEQRWMARTLDETLVSLETALDEAKRAEARMRRFVDDAAHQLRGPITAIRSTLEAFLTSCDPAEGDRLLGAMVREVARASRLATQLLNLAKVEHGPPTTSAPCKVLDVCTAEVERARALAPHLTIALRRFGSVTVRSIIDGVALGEILGNLLENSIRHAVSSIEVLVSVAEAAVNVRVSDDGPGLPPQLTERAFERFVSLDGRGGSGLGLPIARALARAHGGQLTYESGAFIVELPKEAPERDVPRASARRVG